MAKTEKTNQRPARVLIVEDETIVAMMIEDALSDYGCSVVGPVGTLPAALELARDENIDAAILDLNLGGEPSYPVAELLRRRGVPFLFLTGYGSENIVPEYTGETMLRKPIDVDVLSSTVLKIVAEAKQGAS